MNTSLHIKRTTRRPRTFPACGLAFPIFLLLTFALAVPAPAQVLTGAWVDQSQQAIEAHRMADARVLVLDEAGQPVPRAQVRMRLVRHAFPFGVRVDLADIDNPPWHDRLVWRSFSAVSLDAVSGWADVQPEPDAWDFSAVDRIMAFSEEAGLSVRWGSVVSADLGRVPGWAAALEPAQLRDAAGAHARQVARRYGQRVLNLDIYTHTLRHDTTTRRMGAAGERWLYETVGAHSPHTPRTAHFDGNFASDAQAIFRRVTAMREAFVPLDMIAVEVDVSGNVVQGSLKRSLDWLATLKVPILVTNLRVGGASASTAAMNMETVLRTLFAHPAIHGIWFDHITAAHAGDSAAVLLNPAGEATPAGAIVDGLISGLWSTNRMITTDSLGNARARVFAGRYELTATLPDGRTITAAAWIDRNEDRPPIVLQATGQENVTTDEHR